MVLPNAMQEREKVRKTREGNISVDKWAHIFSIYRCNDVTICNENHKFKRNFCTQNIFLNNFASFHILIII